MAELQERQQFGKSIGRERRMTLSFKSPFEQSAAMTGEINEVAGGCQHLIAALGHQDADLGQRRIARPALDKIDVELPSPARECIDSAGWVTAQPQRRGQNAGRARALEDSAMATGDHDTR